MPIKIGIGLTLALIITIIYLALIYRCLILASGALECRQNYLWFLDSPPNEIGDTIAGVFATLAFVWIVVTVFLQSAELAEQRKELSLTREELKLAREAQEKQVNVLQAQAEIFLDEKKHRDEVRAYSEVDALVSEMESIVKGDRFLDTNWKLERVRENGSSSIDHYVLIESPDHFRSRSNTPLLASLTRALSDADTHTRIALQNGWVLNQAPNLSEELQWFHRSAERIEKLYPVCSIADQVRVRSLGLSQLREAIEEIENHPNYWRVWAGSATP